MRVLSAAQMREIDRRTIEEIGVPGVVLMESAGRATADILCADFADLFPGPVLVLCGKGNNGGDGYVVARHLLNRGWQVDILLLADASAVQGDAAVNLRVLQAMGAAPVCAPDSETLEHHLRQCRPALVVDALFGTGLNAELRGPAVAAVDWVNAFSGPVLAVDIPSGVDASSGRRLGCAVRAEVTVSFAAAKLGHLVEPGRHLSGRLKVVDIGIPPHLAGDLDPRYRLLTADTARQLLPHRPTTGHKGSFGHLLVIAGSRGKSGAAILAARAGIRSGAGLLTLALPASQQPVAAASLPEAMTEPLPDRDGAIGPLPTEMLAALVAGHQAVAAGPGLGQGRAVLELVSGLMREVDSGLLLDADALNVLATCPELFAERRSRPLVLTPHPGEMARLCNCSVSEIEADRVAAAGDFARRHQVVLVLKGAPTLIAAPNGDLTINTSGGPLLAVGGSGDVLTGLVGGLLAQGLSPFDAACLGTYLHGAAADRLSRRLGDAGLLARELADEIAAARLELRGGEIC